MKTLFSNYGLYLVFIILFISCGTDVDDNLKNERPVLANDFEFVDKEGNKYYTGLTTSFCYGYNSGSANDTLVLKDLVVPDSLPAFFDLSDDLPPVGDQGKQSSCVAWATGYYLKSYQEKIKYDHEYNDSTIMSPSFVYNQLTKGDCSGTEIHSALMFLKDEGICSIEKLPYSDESCDIYPSEEAINEAANIKISNFKTLSGENMVDEMKTLILMQKPIVVAVALDKEFGVTDSYGISAYREHTVTKDDIEGAHAMLVTGYSDEYKAFKLVNSWGEGFGDDGFVWIDYKAFENVLTPGYDFKVICSAYVAFNN